MNLNLGLVIVPYTSLFTQEHCVFRSADMEPSRAKNKPVLTEQNAIHLYQWVASRSQCVSFNFCWCNWAWALTHWFALKLNACGVTKRERERSWVGLSELWLVARELSWLEHGANSIKVVGLILIQAIHWRVGPDNNSRSEYSVICEYLLFPLFLCYL